MATKTTKGEAGAKGNKEALAAAAEARKAAAAKDRFLYVGEPTKKIAPQAQVIVKVIQAAGEQGLSREGLVENLKGVLQTRQPEGRILSYYQKLIVEVGAVKIVAGQ